ncbi:putative aldo/keto reductase-like oxidoreductase [Chitinophaga sp. W2I13]|uniref:hypothetical protein n=1 Tax=Chitinophaga sp. W2I13 TaxID=3373923 RepID=UPI003D258387
MKKAQLLLLISIASSIAGGALAFKARNNLSIFYMETISGGQRLCTVPTAIHSVITDFGRSTLLSTSPTYTACPTIQITTDL